MNIIITVTSPADAFWSDCPVTLWEELHFNYSRITHKIIAYFRDAVYLEI